MNSLAEKKAAITGFWEIESEAARARLLQEIKDYSNTKSDQELTAEIRATFEQRSWSGIGVLYEALSTQPKRWSNFFREEYERAFTAAETATDARDTLDSLQEISMVKADELTTADQVIRLLESYLPHQRVAIRYKAVTYLGDWLSSDKARKYTEVVQAIKTCLRDESWRVRYVAKLTLQDANQLPTDFKLSLLDRLRAKFLDINDVE